MKKKEPEQIEVIDMGGAKTVAKKTSWVTKVKRIFAIFTIIWFLFVALTPLYIKSHYGEPIKKTIVVSMFFDLQRNIQEQYEKLLEGIKKSINLEKPIAVAIDKVRMAEKGVQKAQDVTSKAKETSDAAKKIGGIASKFGLKSGSIDNAVAKADSAITKADDTARLVNSKLDTVERELVKASQTEVDKMIDEAIKHQLDKSSGGLGTTFLTDYGIKHVYPWRPSSWPVGVRIYNDLEKSNVGVIQILTRTVDTYYGYVAWGLVFAAWAIGIFIWLKVYGKVKSLIAPFIVCPRCGHTFADKRTAFGLLKALQPWKWF